MTIPSVLRHKLAELCLIWGVKLGCQLGKVLPFKLNRGLVAEQVQMLQIIHAGWRGGG